jgi:hypothetical protein
LLCGSACWRCCCVCYGPRRFLASAVCLCYILVSVSLT